MCLHDYEEKWIKAKILLVCRIRFSNSMHRTVPDRTIKQDSNGLFLFTY